MQLSHVCLLAAGLIMSAAPAKADDPEWQTQDGTQATYTAVVAGEQYARLVVECRNPAFFSPEIDITLVLPANAKIAETGTQVATFQTGTGGVRLRMTPVGETYCRWTGVGAAGMSSARNMAEVVPVKSPLTIELPGVPLMTFKFGYLRSSAMEDVVLRCLPSVVRARRQAAGLTNTQALLTLEGDANDRCRGGGVEDVMGACAERTEYVERLHTIGMCYGKAGQSGADMRWHRCGPGSIR